MAVNKKKREEEKEKRKRKDSPRVVGMSVQFEHCSKCSNIAKQGQIVRTVFEQHTNARRAVRALFEHMEREYNISEHCPNSVQTARKAVRDV